MIAAAKATCPEPGIYHDVPFREYCEWDAMNMSTLLEGRETMEHLKAAIDGKLKKTSSAMSFGRAFHARILEPVVYKNEWQVATRCRGIMHRGKTNEARCPHSGNRISPDGVWFCGKHGEGLGPPDQWVTQDEAERIEQIAEKIKTHDVVKLFRRHGGFETSMVWDYRGVRFKGRFDKYIHGQTCPDTIVDPKKVPVRKGGLDAFGKAIEKYGYHIRAACYMTGCEIMTGTRPEFIWVAIEDTYPHSVGVYQMVPEDFDIGRYEFDSLVTNYLRCLSDNNWPGYSSDIKRLPLLPGYYAKRKLEEMQSIAH